MALKKLLYDARGITPKPCGVRNVAENYLRELAPHYDVVALVNPETAHLVDPAIRMEPAPRYCSRFGLLSDFWVSRQVLKHKPDIFFSAHSFLPPFAILPRRRAFVCHDVFAALDKSFFGKRGRLAPLARFFFRLLSEISFFRASIIVAPSAAIAETFKGLWMQPRKLVVIHNGVSLRPLPAGQRENRVLYVGNFRPYKGFDTLYEAWQSLQDQASADNWVLDVVTNEPAESVARFVAAHGTLPRLHFHSRISDAALDAMRRSTRIAVVPSRQEGFGIPLIEAIDSGGTVVYSDIPVFRELLVGLDQEQLKPFAAEDARALANVLGDAMRKTGEGDDADGPNQAMIRARHNWSVSGARLAAELG
jgi:glycosyltransferase involved in cell wall biosynthesis